MDLGFGMEFGIFPPCRFPVRNFLRILDKGFGVWDLGFSVWDGIWDWDFPTALFPVRNFLRDVLLAGGSQSPHSRAMSGQITLSQVCDWGDLGEFWEFFPERPSGWDFWDRDPGWDFLGTRLFQEKGIYLG